MVMRLRKHEVRDSGRREERKARRGGKKEREEEEESGEGAGGGEEREREREREEGECWGRSANGHQTPIDAPRQLCPNRRQAGFTATGGSSLKSPGIPDECRGGPPFAFY
jgi:hypothetical protein